MARTPSPWFWEERGGWYVTRDGRRHFLGDHPAGAPAPRKVRGKWNAPPAVVQAFHTLMAAPPGPPPAATPPAAGPTVAEVLDRYLDWCQRHRAGRTYDWYRDHLQSFLASLPGAATFAAADLRPFHVVGWADRDPGWSPAYRRGAIVAVQRPFNWAVEMGYLPDSPVKKIKKPRPQRRENPLTPAEFAGILARYPEGDPFRDLLEFAWHTGCRPQEARLVEARHVFPDKGLVAIPPDEAKGKKRWRLIHLVGRALEVVGRLLAKSPRGNLFLNEDGRPWTAYAVGCRFYRLQTAVGMEKLRELGLLTPAPRFDPAAHPDATGRAAARLAHRRDVSAWKKATEKLARQHGRRFALVDARHGFCERLLEDGVDHLTVAELMGHASGQMVAETYSHLGRAHGHLKEVLKKASGASE